MITYKNIDYNAFEEFREALNSELAALAYPYAVKHKTYGEGQLTFIKAPLMGGSLYATIEFTVGVKTLAVDVVLSNDLLEMPDILLDTLLEAQTLIKADFIERQETQRRANIEALEQALAEKKKAIKEKAAEEKKETKKHKQ